jgi:hypothetical protein
LLDNYFFKKFCKGTYRELRFLCFTPSGKLSTPVDCRKALCQLSIAVTKYPRQAAYRKERFVVALTVVEVLVRGYLVWSLWACGKVVSWQGASDRAKLFTSWWPGSKERKRKGVKY